MSLQSVTAFQPFVMEPPSRPPRAGASLSRRLAALLGREPESRVSAHLAGVVGRPDVYATVRAALGADCPLVLREGDRLPTQGPLLVLIVRDDAPDDDAAGPGNAVSPAGLVRVVRSCDAPVLLVRACSGPWRAVVGTPIPAERLARIASDEALLRWLRARADVLRHRPTSTAGLGVAPAAPLAGAVAVAHPMAADLVEAELAALPPEQHLLESGRFVVVQARAHQMPACVREIGRLREITFRAAGEGSGRALDLDAHDRTYRHLVLFDRDERRVAGAYRFAPTDEILPVFGLRGLYTSTLFRIDPELFEELGPALELGRSFVRAEYQRAYAPLLLLWRGLCAFVARHPRYRTLFGAVSVSATYTPFSRALLARTLSGAATSHPLSHHVGPRHPLVPPRALRRDLERLPAMLEDAPELSAVIADVEPDGKAMPVLLREYLKLGGRMLGFSVDPAFGGVLDGLVAVDLTRSPRRLLAAYMGREAAEAFVAHHAPAPGKDDRAA